MIQLTRHLGNTYCVKDVMLGTGGIEIPKPNYFIHSLMVIMVRIINNSKAVN